MVCARRYVSGGCLARMDVWCGDLLRFAFPRTVSERSTKGCRTFSLSPSAAVGQSEKISNDGDQREQAELHKELAMQLLPGRAVDNALHIFYANQSGAQRQRLGFRGYVWR